MRSSNQNPRRTKGPGRDGLEHTANPNNFHQNQRHQHKTKKTGSSVPFQKERFMQANYKFAVYPNIYEHVAMSSSYSRRVFDGTIENVDKILDHDVIFQVVLSTNKPYQCVVCLGDLMCPKISMCGHVFCWTCVVQYFASRIQDDPTVFSLGKQRCPCPVCQSTLEIADFCPVQIILQEKNVVGGKMNFYLASREKTSTVVCLKSAEDSFFADTYQSSANPKSKANFFPTRFPSLDSSHAPMNRVNVAFSQDIESLWAKEEKELEEQVKESLSSQDPATPLFLLAQDFHNRQKEDFLKDENKYIFKPHKPSHPKTPVDKSQQVLFYQESSGEHIFLHPISVRWLLKEYTTEKLPHNVEGKVLLLEDEITQDESTRKRYRFLVHLPICCNFRFCLIDISPLLGAENASGFLEEAEALKKQMATQANQKRQHEKHLQKQLQERYFKEQKAAASSQAVLYQRLTHPETVSHDSANFPLLPGAPPAPAPNAPRDPPPPVPSKKWSDPDSNSKLRQTLQTREENFPALSSSSPSTPKTPAWGANHIRDIR